MSFFDVHIIGDEVRSVKSTGKVEYISLLGILDSFSNVDEDSLVLDVEDNVDEDSLVLDAEDNLDEDSLVLDAEDNVDEDSLFLFFLL